MFDLNSYMAETTCLIDQTLEKRLPSASTEPTRLHEAMRYSLFAGGKRIRPILSIAATEALSGQRTQALVPGAAVEILHTYTLIHDDLPAMDDDALRRGCPTCHIAFDEATAILAGDALLTLTFSILCDTECVSPYSPSDLVRELASASGSTGVIGGQMADIEGEGKDLSIEQLQYIHTHKTGDLIRAAVRMGAMSAGANEEQLAALTTYAEKIGLAFQIADDVLNATGTSEELGKASGTDAEAGKMTYVAAYGIEGARERAAKLVLDAKESLKKLPGDTDPLSAIADYIVDRKK